jgi:glycyl-tRNA synthetase
MDEVGTPYCITVDFETLEDDTVTIRSRDTTEQRRIHVKDLFKLLSKEVDGFDEDED